MTQKPISIENETRDRSELAGRQTSNWSATLEMADTVYRRIPSVKC